VTLHGVSIPPASLVVACVGSANRDPAHFADPERFDAARTPNPHLAFGHGIHFCIGSALARLEARVGLGELLTRLPGLRLADGMPWTPREGFHVHGPSRLEVRFQAA
jgi:cytochrome P450